MSTRGRIAVALAADSLLAVTHLVSASSSGNAALGGDAWGWSVVATTVVAIVATFVVDRWWALLLAFVPMAVGLCLPDPTDSIFLWQDGVTENQREPLPFEALLVYAIPLNLLLLWCGLVLRRLRDGARSARRVG